VYAYPALSAKEIRRKQMHSPVLDQQVAECQEYLDEIVADTRNQLQHTDTTSLIVKMSYNTLLMLEEGDEATRDTLCKLLGTALVRLAQPSLDLEGMLRG
jgi:hypothetical protein